MTMTLRSYFENRVEDWEPAEADMWLRQVAIDLVAQHPLMLEIERFLWKKELVAGEWTLRLRRCDHALYLCRLNLSCQRTC